MKTPRVDAFVANKKRVPELKSSLDHMPAIEQPQPSGRPPAPVRPAHQAQAGTESPRRKIKTRHPFDIFEDQLEELRKLSMEDRMQGGYGSMSAMVREALDTYIGKKRGKVRTRNPRTPSTGSAVSLPSAGYPGLPL